MKKVFLIILVLVVSCLLMIKCFEYSDHLSETQNIDHHLPFGFERTFENNPAPFTEFNESGLEQRF